MNILHTLETAPENIRLAAEKVAQTRTALDRAKHQEKVAVAKATIRHQGAKNQKILEAMVEQDPEVIAQVAATITAQGEYERAKIAHDHQYNLFVSARKLGSMDERELHAISGSTIRVSPAPYGE